MDGQRSATDGTKENGGLTGLETSALGADVRLWNGESHGPRCIAGVEVLNPPGLWAWADSGADTLLLWTPDIWRGCTVWVKKNAALVSMT